MSKEKMLDIIKSAILLERKGKAFYETVARQTQSPAVRGIFETMSAEETKHIDVLSKHFENVAKKGTLSDVDYEDQPENFSARVITQQIKNEITAAGYEAAAISAAMAMEDRAVSFYSGRASETSNQLEKELFEWLANWEKTHLQFLSEIDKELQQSVWYDNQFWPMA